MRGVDVLAGAQWASVVLSVLSIAIALYVFLAEQRRGNIEKQREAARELKQSSYAAAAT